MGRTARYVSGSGAIAVLLALAAVAGAPAPAAADGITPPPPRAESPSASVDETATPAGSRELTLRGVLELLVLALTCAAAMAFYSETAGERGGTRVPARVRRR